MKALWKKWQDTSLVLRIVCGLAIGAVLGLTVPQWTGIAILGNIFVGALKGIAPVLVFCLVISAISKGGESHGGTIKTVVILYMASTLLASVIAVFASMVFKVEMILPEAVSDMSAPQGVAEVLKTLLMNVVSNPVNALASANYIGILSWACIIGLALRGASNEIKTLLSEVSDAISMVVTWIINLAPFGILGLVFD